MDLKSIGLLVAGFVFLLMIWGIWKRERSKRRIRKMNEEEKWQLLSDLTKPFGFLYEPTEDIFVSDLDAWQRESGYHALFDDLAPRFNMVFDAFPVYFDYQGKTWLIEFWKGQYGINTGAEVGVYHANRLIPKEQQRLVHYNVVSDDEMPLIGMCLQRKEEKTFSYKKYHWWLAAFRMGQFSKPKDLKLYVNLTFDSIYMAEAFVEGLEEADYLPWKYRVRGRRVSLQLEESQTHRGLENIHRKLVQVCNRSFCGLYRFITLPFTKTADRMLFLYEQLPWCFRHMLRLHAFGKKHK